MEGGGGVALSRYIGPCLAGVWSYHTGVNTKMIDEPSERRTEVVGEKSMTLSCDGLERMSKSPGSSQIELK